MTRGRQSRRVAPGLVALLACALLASALLAASLGLPAAASAAGSVDPTAPGPVTPVPPVLDDLMGRGDGVAAPALPIGLGALPGARETAAFAAGRVAVGVVFLESDGSIMTSSEDWTREDPDYPGQDRRQLVLAKIQGALDWWNARSPDGSLELFLPAAGSYGAPQTVPTGYEPIRRDVAVGWKGRPVLSDAAWRWQAMGRLGFAHDATDDTPYPETLFADRLRRRNGADWAFVVYVVDSLQDADGMFRNRVVAYTADLFGPYCMLTLRQRRLPLRQLRRGAGARDGPRVRRARRVRPARSRLPEHRRPQVRLPRRAQRQRGARRDDGPALHHARVQRDADRLRGR